MPSAIPSSRVSAKDQGMKVLDGEHQPVEESEQDEGDPHDDEPPDRDEEEHEAGEDAEHGHDLAPVRGALPQPPSDRSPRERREHDGGRQRGRDAVPQPGVALVGVLDEVLGDDVDRPPKAGERERQRPDRPGAQDPGPAPPQLG